MESKDKVIGAVLIIVGIIFIGLGVFVGINNGKKVNVYNEPTIEQQPVEEQPTNNETPEQDNNDVNVYSEVENNNGSGTTRYVY